MAAVSQHSLQMPNNSTYAHSIAGMPHGLGLLTTVASLPPKYRSRYLNIKTKCEIPLDLSRKSMSPQLESEVPMASNFAEVYTEPASCSDTASQGSEEILDELVKQCQMIAADNKTVTAAAATNTKDNTTLIIKRVVQSQEHMKPITPPPTPTKKRKFSETSLGETDAKENQSKVPKVQYTKVKQPLVENTPAKPIKSLETAPKTSKNQAALAGVSGAKANRNNKATRKLKFDEETSSPVSGTIIRPLEDITDGSMQYSNGDIDPKYNIVEITEETKAELAAIKNVIGDYVCKLCRIKFEDAFGLAQHRCACIVLLEYRCPECGKQFNCPANLASHRRWHKPRKDGSVANMGSAAAPNKKESKEQKSNKKLEDSEIIYSCQECGKKFKRQAYLKKHQLTHGQKLKEPRQRKTLNPADETPVSTTSSSAASTSLSANTSPVQHKVTTIVQRGCSTNPAVQPATQEPPYTKSTPHIYDDQDETMSDYSSAASSQGYGRLQIIETGLTEEENIAATALTNLRNCASVIQHTTLAH